jgi:sister-chromatid-cohesion protein PDS5
LIITIAGLTCGDDEPACFKYLQEAPPPPPPTRMVTTPSHDSSGQLLGKQRQSQKVESQNGSLTGQSVVGKRVVVWWPLERDWFQGLITRFNKAKNNYTIKYDDGDLDVVHLPNQYVRFMVELT